MKVHELIRLLKTINGDNEIIMSSDAEGNRFHNVHELSLGESSDEIVIWPEHSTLTRE